LHRGTTNPLQNFLYLDTTQAADTGTIGTGADSTTFTVTAGSAMNANGGTYVAYLFAHNAGGFGLTGTDNVISCGSYTGNGGATGPTVTLGYEPQWLLVKKSSGAQDWFLFDNMRGVATDGDDYYLLPNSSNAETTGGNTLDFTATGFVPKGAFDLNTSGTYIYIAIRRGPMKTPTSGTSVFSPVTRTGTGANTTTVAGFPVDMGMTGNRGAVASKFGTVDRLRGAPYLITSATAAEVTDATVYQANPFDTQTALKIGTTSAITNASGNTYVDHLFRRAPGFFDVVCYTGTGSATTQSHNLGVVPELMIVKPRSAVNGWSVYAASQGANKYLFLDTTAATATATTLWNNTTPTSSVFSVGVANLTNQSGQTFVAYLFATVAGVSKVGSYTGTGALQTVNCGFTSGARFVLIKRTDSTGDWYVYDSSRGITSGNDPYLLLNSTAAEATATNYVDTDTTGFKVTAAAPAGLNASGGTYIFLAIA
jgi:hypothetical protein